ncbi:YecH family metal-binding protein [Vibrio rarus]|uniref:YecH family metal-binding protein n=1 Tax=Vibrio rarus TaxID=413403 RepID=UPI0021C3A2BA|nr:YecH family metal-binding protein [Vibrio rarus]
MSVHAHKILNQLREQPMTKAELNAWVATEFGENTEFRTCSKEGFDFDAILTFFLSREKIVLDGDKFKVNESNICSHN